MKLAEDEVTVIVVVVAAVVVEAMVVAVSPIPVQIRLQELVPALVARLIVAINLQ